MNGDDVGISPQNGSHGEEIEPMIESMHGENDRNGIAGQVLNGRRQAQRGSLQGRNSAWRDSRNRSAGRTLRIAERWRSPVTGRMTRGTPSFQTVESGRVMLSSPR